VPHRGPSCRFFAGAWRPEFADELAIVQRALEFIRGSVKLVFEMRDAAQQHFGRFGFAVRAASFPIAADDHAKTKGANMARGN
jgi:hypothetical protein